MTFRRTCTPLIAAGAAISALALAAIAVGAREYPASLELDRLQKEALDSLDRRNAGECKPPCKEDEVCQDYRQRDRGVGWDILFECRKLECPEGSKRDNHDYGGDACKECKAHQTCRAVGASHLHQYARSRIDGLGNCWECRDECPVGSFARSDECKEYCGKECKVWKTLSFQPYEACWACPDEIVEEPGEVRDGLRFPKRTLVPRPPKPTGTPPSNWISTTLSFKFLFSAS